MKRTYLDSSVLTADELITGEKPGKPLHQVKGLKVLILAASSA